VSGYTFVDRRLNVQSQQYLELRIVGLVIEDWRLEVAMEYVGIRLVEVEMVQYQWALLV